MFFFNDEEDTTMAPHEDTADDMGTDDMDTDEEKDTVGGDTTGGTEDGDDAASM